MIRELLFLALCIWLEWNLAARRLNLAHEILHYPSSASPAAAPI
jgi:hypothetical protein